MFTHPCNRLADAQQALFQNVNNRSKTIGRLCSVPVAIIDVTAHVSDPFIQSAVAILNCAANILGLGFNSCARLRSMVSAIDITFYQKLEMIFKYSSIRAAVEELDIASENLFAGFGRIPTSPVCLAYQIGSLILDPENTTTISTYYKTP